jgi:acylphosphatase
MRRRYLIEGEVQGVGFRYFTVRAAQRLGVRGWVRNLAGGSVEALGEGSEDQLSRFEAELRRGPSLARVKHVHGIDAGDEAEASRSFEIR